MWNWFTYFLTMVMTVVLVVGGGVCGCAQAHAMGPAHHAISETDTSDEPMTCGCAHGEHSDDEESQCPCGCDEISENSGKVAKSADVAIATNNPLDGFELPVLQPRFQALLAVWFADLVEPFLAFESEVVATYIDPGPPRVDVPIYLQVQNLRL